MAKLLVALTSAASVPASMAECPASGMTICGRERDISLSSRGVRRSSTHKLGLGERLVQLPSGGHCRAKEEVSSVGEDRAATKRTGADDVVATLYNDGGDLIVDELGQWA